MRRMRTNYNNECGGRFGTLGPLICDRDTRQVAVGCLSTYGTRTPHGRRRCITWFCASRCFDAVTYKFQGGGKAARGTHPTLSLSFEKGLSVPVKKRDLNRKGLVKRGKNFRRPSWEQAEIETKRKRPFVVAIF